MRLPTWLSFFIFVFPLAVLPVLLSEPVLHGLAKLRLTPELALVLVFAMLATGLVNIPVKRVAREGQVADHPLAIVGHSHLWPRLQRFRQGAIVAVNVGGGLIPAGIALYESWRLSTLGREAILGGTVAVIVNSIVCYLIAEPVARVGIAVPGLVSPLVAVGLAWILAPDQAPPVALVAGVIGRLVGADLLHLKDVERAEVGIVSIGGAGTFDSIVLSGAVAAYLN